jgi:quinol monooxygenase YgiN
MDRYVVIRTVEMPPEAVERTAEWLRATEPTRQAWGMLFQLLARQIISPRTYVLVQVWQSEEAYNRWRASEDRKKLAAEAPRMYIHATTYAYREV